MKKNLFILAAAAIAFTACSSDETIAVNEDLADANTISFRPTVNGMTRGNATDPRPKASFNTDNAIDVYADFNGSKYFKATFTKQDESTFTSGTTKYYWPSDLSSSKKMTFWAVYGATQADKPGAEITSFTPAPAAASQIDVLVAKKVVEASVPEATGVMLNFRHALSQIDVNIKNTNPSLKVTVSGVRIGYVDQIGKFFYNHAVVDTNGDSDIDDDDDADVGPETTEKDNDNINQLKWRNTAATGADANKYSQFNNGTDGTDGLSENTVLTGNASDAWHPVTGFNTWLLLPQEKTAAANYTSTGTTGDTPTLDGAYIALEMVIENYNGSTTTGTIVSKQWCYWPITVDWTPGYKYTYQIDVAGGGYQPSDRNTNVNLDKVLPEAIVFAATCSIDEWDTSNVAVNM